MPRSLQVLLVEDNATDAELIRRQLAQSGFDPRLDVVDDETSYIAALIRKPDLVISDWSLPGFSGLRALELLRLLDRDLPFLLVSGTIGEESAVAAMKQGATDYLLKDRLARLGTAVEQALEQARLRRQEAAATAALAVAEASYRDIVENAAEGVFQLSPDGRFLKVNPALARLAGFASPYEMVQHIADASRQWFADPARYAEWQRQLDTQEVVRNFEGQLRRQDGTLSWTSTNARAVRLRPNGPVSYYEGLVTDITERRTLETQFRQAQKMEAIGVLAGGIAHDFNNLLSAIIGHAELASLRSRDNPDVTRHLESLLQGAFRASALVRQILAFSRTREQPHALLHLRHVLAEPLDLLRSTLPATVELSTSFDADLPAVRADVAQIQQAIMNLCTNGWQAMKARPGKLTVTIARENVEEAFARSVPNLRAGPYVRLSVQDTGAGMDPATLERIFEPFFTTKAPGEGSGLGLAAVHGIMRNHGGAIAVESQVGTGTTFRLYFPADAQEAEIAPSTPSLAPRGRGECILLVDDEPALVRLGRAMLEELGYFVIPFGQAEAALAAVRAEPGKFDVVITDLTMPGLTGLDLARELKQLSPDLPVLLVSGRPPATGDNDTAARAGIFATLPKPLTLQALGTGVYRALAARPGRPGPGHRS